MTNVPEQFEKIVKSFYGSTAGNIHSPIWICGLEWGGGYDESIPIFIDNIEPYSFESLHVWSAKQFANYFWASQSAFCRNVIKLLYGLKTGNCSNWSSVVEDWYKDGIAGPNGIAMILNAYPISFKNRDQAYRSWSRFQVRFADGRQDQLMKWTGLDTFDIYRNYVIESRSEVFISERKKRAPKLIIALGYENHQKLWGAEKQSWDGADFKFSSKPEKEKNDCFGYWLDNGFNKEKTLLLITPFPTGSHGLVSNTQINTVCQKLESELGKNWLATALEKKPNCQLDKFNQIDSSDFDLYGDCLMDKISRFKELANQQLTCLEQIEKDIQRMKNSQDILLNQFKADLTTPNKLKVKIIEHLNALEELSVTAKAIRSAERQLAWAEVAKQR